MKIENKYLRYLAIFIIICIALWIEYQDLSFNNPQAPSDNIVYTKHALCRIDCRQISKSEVAKTISAGEINHKKSDPNALPCPTYAYETSAGRKLRIVVGACPNKTKIITAIDLNRKFNCSCY